MSKQNLISSIGPIMQIAFVPEDFDAAIEFWTKTMGVGPFFNIEHAGLKNMRFEGQPSEADFGLAIAYWGDVQIELIYTHNDVPSIYKTAPYATSGMHHVCLVTEDVKAARQTAVDAGAKIIFEADVGEDGGVFYCDPGGAAGDTGLVEVLQPATGGLDFFAMLKAASQTWDGVNPFLELG